MSDLKERFTEGMICPFCGCSAVYTQPRYFFDALVEENGTACLVVECKCGAQMRSYGNTNYITARAKLARMWNRRV